jgi:hypothetical protein
MAVEVLNKEYGMLNNISPQGRKLGWIPLESNPSLLEIHFVDDKGGRVPDELGGLWTGARQAQEAIQIYLTKFWDTSDKIAASKKAA